MAGGPRRLTLARVVTLEIVAWSWFYFSVFYLPRASKTRELDRASAAAVLGYHFVPGEPKVLDVLDKPLKQASSDAHCGCWRPSSLIDKRDRDGIHCTVNRVRLDLVAASGGPLVFHYAPRLFEPDRVEPSNDAARELFQRATGVPYRESPFPDSVRLSTRSRDAAG